MPPKLSELVAKGLAHPPSGYDQLIQLEAYMGSAAYGVSSDTSDLDVYGFLIPAKDMVFPHLRGEIEGFGKKGNRFEVYTQHAIKDPAAAGGTGKEYDYSIYSIVKFFQLCSENNPNMVDALFVPDRCILHMTPIGQMVREKRHMFLTKRIYHTCKGYAYQQLHKMRIKNPSEDSKRFESVQKFGFDPKFAYHIVRLVDQCHQVLTEGDLDLERNREKLKAIRRGEWTLEDIEAYFNRMEATLAKVVETSTLPWGPDMEKIKGLLLDCLEQHFGSLTGVVVRQDKAQAVITQIKDLIATAGL